MANANFLSCQCEQVDQHCKPEFLAVAKGFIYLSGMARLAHLNALRALEAAVRHGSFKAAAIELGVTPAAVGQQVRTLEAVLGQRLLIRRPNRFEPTATALLAVQKLGAGFEYLREGLALAAAAGVPSRLSISVAPTIAEGWLVPRLSEFLAGHPEVDLRIDTTVRIVDLTSGDHDLAIRYGPPSASGHEEFELFGEILLPVCSPDLVRSIRRENGSSAVAEAPLLHVERETSDPDWIDWEAWGRRFGYTIPRIDQGLRFSRTTMAVQAAYGGLGLLLAQLSITLPRLATGQLIAPFGPDLTVRTGFSYRLVRATPGRNTTLQRAFITWIQNEAQKTHAEMEQFASR